MHTTLVKAWWECFKYAMSTDFFTQLAGQWQEALKDPNTQTLMHFWLQNGNKLAGEAMQGYAANHAAASVLPATLNPLLERLCAIEERLTKIESRLANSA
jgi:DNA-binding transcriptional regulator YbjK